MDRAPGLSVRLKLTLSYAGFLMVAEFVLLAAVWVFLLRYVPNESQLPDPARIGVLLAGPTRDDLVRAFVPKAAWALVFLLAFGLLGGWLLAGRMLAPLSRITNATRRAARGSLSHRIELEGRGDEFRELADTFDAMLARLETQVAEQQRFAANASHELRTPLAITQTLLDVARNDPHRDSRELDERLRAVNGRAIALTEALLLLSRSDQRSFTPEPVDLSLLAEQATETLLPFAERHGVTISTSGDITPTLGSNALLLQLTTNLVHNAIVHNLQEHGTVQVHTSLRPEFVLLTVENSGDRLDSPAGLDPHRAVPARHRTHPRRPCGCRPRPRHRQEHYHRTRRNTHPEPADGRGSQRPGPAAGSPDAGPRRRPRQGPPPLGRTG